LHQAKRSLGTLVSMRDLHSCCYCINSRDALELQQQSVPLRCRPYTGASPVDRPASAPP
jgi:hypothetical protein